ncbi:MAG TPA: hypothetical protein VHU23_18975 [Rhizomicrobium sp.]|jgi:hypothetical protein|nr:hypothetical protein [Rhizomicrobium sp.]
MNLLPHLLRNAHMAIAALGVCATLSACAVYPIGQDADGLDMRRDANRVMMALEDWHRTKGAFPRTLDELVPRYLPALPKEPVLHYRATDGSLAFRYVPSWPQLRPVWCSSVGNSTNWVCSEHLLFS